MRLWRVVLVLVFGTPLALTFGLTVAGKSETPGLPPLVQMLSKENEPAVQLDVLRGMQEALIGRRHVAMPSGWPIVFRKLAASPLPEVRERAMALSVLFGDQQALTTLRIMVGDPKASRVSRQKALQTLVETKDPGLVPLLRSFLADDALRGPALRSLAVYSDEATPAIILRHYSSFTEEDKNEAIQTLASRPLYALALLDAVEKDLIPRRDLSAFTIRQIKAFNNKAIDEKLSRVWGTIRSASQDKAALMARYKNLLTSEFLTKANPVQGRLIFSRTCAGCHRLFDAGGNIGPELTGSQRANLDYVLENVLDPSAIVPFDYQVTVIETRDGRLLTGIIKQEDDRTVTVQTQTDRVVVLKNEIDTRARSPVSMMPEGLLAKLNNEEVRDLVVYLAGPFQVALPGDGSKP